MDRRRKIETLGKNLEALLRKRQWGNQVYLFALERQWAEITGPEIAQQSMPAFFRRDVLWIYVQGSAWMQQLQFAKLEMLAQINTFLQPQCAVVDLRFLEYPPELQKIIQQDRRFHPSPVDPVAEQKFTVMADSIPDIDTKEALCRMWRRLTAKLENEKLHE